MVFIDNKGRLFGKLNLIDFIIIILVIVVIILGVKFAIYKPQIEFSSVDVIVQNQPLYITQNVEAGDAIFYNGNLVGSIVSLEITNDGENKKNMLIKANLMTVTKDNKTTYANNELKIGSSINIDTRRVNLNGIVKEIYKKNANKEIPLFEKTVEIKLKNAEEWKIDAVPIGDKELNSKNKLMAEIIDKKVKPSEFVVVTESGEVLRREHPTEKDMVLTIRIQLENVDGYLIFHDKEVKVGKELEIHTNKIDIGGTIISVT